jgi:hypothetical protein
MRKFFHSIQTNGAITTAPSKKRAPVNVIGPINGATMDCGTNAQPHAQAAMRSMKLAWVRVNGLDIKKNSTNRFKSRSVISHDRMWAIFRRQGVLRMQRQPLQ